MQRSRMWFTKNDFGKDASSLICIAIDIFFFSSVQVGNIRNG